MHLLNDKEIEDGIYRIVKVRQERDSYAFYDLEVHCVKNLPTSIVIEIRAEYEKPCACDDSLLEEIREHVGAAFAEFYNDIDEGGCDTCDYGSSYGFAVRVWD